MSIVPVAYGKVRQSQVRTSRFYFSWQVRELTQEEKHQLATGWSDWRMHGWTTAYVLERVRTWLSENGTMFDEEPEIIDMAPTFEEAFFHSSTDYLQGRSVHPLHAEFVRSVKLTVTVNGKITHWQEHERRLKQTYQERFDHELKQERLYTRLQRGDAPLSKVNKVRERVRFAHDVEAARTRLILAALRRRLAILQGTYPKEELV